ncbi:diguanylate cyclase with PAS/PAC sensor [Halothece sp. PCC 7418]|uniref:diguanylate cyclase domain-containing protein n=1 Tax=Halothece sp. (strain PCC 7418) TaxID=65093 RepID=UPI0002A0637F|nr:diguanylate cyclase [Halothece sp. PCC 7418]AFZ43893.1 diguanylate cyclase with PAS/PAC sensor [Halothece sp. PCC 7418]
MQAQAKPRKVPLYLAFAVPFTLQVLSIVGLVGYLSYRSGQQTVQDLTDQLLLKTENQVVQELDSYLSLPHEINQLNIAMVESGVVDLENLDQLQNYLITEHQKFPQVTSVLFGNPQGAFLFVNDTDLPKGNTAAQELQVEVGRFDLDNPSRVNLYALNVGGTIGRYFKTIKNVDVRKRPWYRRAVTTQTSGWSDLFQIGTGNVLAINAYAPFYNASQELEGVFSINLSLEALNHFLANLTLSNTGEVFILERNGLLVANSADEPVYKTSPRQKGKILEPGKIEFRRIPAQKNSNPVIAEATAALTEEFNDLNTIQSPQQMTFAIETDTGKKDPYFLRVFSYQDDYGLDWLVVTVVPKSEFTGAINANVRRTIALSGVALLASLGLGWWTSRRIARSLLRLSQASKNVAQGKFNDSFSTSRIREVDTLSESFSQMARSLQEAEEFRDHYEAKLEQEVTEKTLALQESYAELQLITDSIAGCISFKDSSHRYQFVNETYEKWLNCSKEEILGKTVEEITGTETYQKISPYLEQVLTGETVAYETDFLGRDGIKRYLSVVLTPKLDENNNVLGYYTLITDISDRKQLELELEQANQDLKQLATVDGLTQIANRRTFDKHLQAEWNRACRQSLPLSLIFCDVDYFKKYNDYYGHQAGDDCLQKVALIIKENCKRAEDFPARYGGEEFAIICAGINADNAKNLAENIRKQLFHSAIPHERNPDQNRVTLSIGIASVIPRPCDKANNLLREADRALYEAKKQGRDRAISFQF